MRARELNEILTNLGLLDKMTFYGQGGGVVPAPAVAWEHEHDAGNSRRDCRRSIEILEDELWHFHHCARWPLSLAERARTTKTREDFVEFLKEFRADYASGHSGWVDADVPTFLEAMAAWINDTDGYYRNAGQNLSDLSPWRIMADVLMAARIYE